MILFLKRTYNYTNSYDIDIKLMKLKGIKQKNIEHS